MRRVEHRNLQANPEENIQKQLAANACPRGLRVAVVIETCEEDEARDAEAVCAFAERPDEVIEVWKMALPLVLVPAAQRVGSKSKTADVNLLAVNFWPCMPALVAHTQQYGALYTTFRHAAGFDTDATVTLCGGGRRRTCTRRKGDSS